jgi:hypothetical protein
MNRVDVLRMIKGGQQAAATGARRSAAPFRGVQDATFERTRNLLLSEIVRLQKAS